MSKEEAHPRRKQKCCGICAEMEEEVVLHLQTHQTRIEAERRKDDCIAHPWQAWVPLEASPKEEPFQTRAFANEERQGG